MKGLILAAGKGRRLNAVDKALLRVKGYHLIAYSLTKLMELQVDEIIIVVGSNSKIPELYYTSHNVDVPVRYVVQESPTGLVDAIELASEFIDGDFYLTLTDEVMVNSRHKEMLEQFQSRKRLAGICGYCQGTLDDVRKTYTIGLKKSGMAIEGLIEKPIVPFNKMVGTGNCIFRKGMLDYIGDTPKNLMTGQRELVDWVQVCINKGCVVEAFNICNEYINVNTEEDLERAGRLMK